MVMHKIKTCFNAITQTNRVLPEVFMHIGSWWWGICIYLYSKSLWALETSLGLMIVLTHTSFLWHKLSPAGFASRCTRAFIFANPRRYSSPGAFVGDIAMRQYLRPVYMYTQVCRQSADVSRCIYAYEHITNKQHRTPILPENSRGFVRLKRYTR